MTLLVTFFVVSITVSFLCSIWEAVLLSITPTFVSRQRQEGGRLVRDLESFKKDIDRPLAAILTLNTIAHTVGAIGVGAQAGKLFETVTLDLVVVEIGFESVVAAAMTLAILVLSEIVPKTLGATYWRLLAPFTIYALRFLVVAMAPFVWMSQGITRALKRDREGSIFSRADFAAMTRVGEETGALDEKESRIIENLLRFESIRAQDVMTPRTVMSSVDGSTTLAAFRADNQPLRFSRVPVHDGDADRITGFVLKDEVLEALLDGEGDRTIAELQKEILAVPASQSLPVLFDVLTRSQAHIAVVVNEFGGIDGLVTMEDVVETLLGIEIVDETDAVADLRRLARVRWEERARRVGLVV